MHFRFLGGRTDSGLVAEPRPGLSFSSPQTQGAPSVRMLPTGKHMETPALHGLKGYRSTFTEEHIPDAQH